MSKVSTYSSGVESPADSTARSLIVETGRGPSVAGTRITVYAIMDYLKEDFIRMVIKEAFRLSDEQLQAALQYVAEHAEELWRDYERLRRSEDPDTYFHDLYQASLPVALGPPPGERAKLMREDLLRWRQEASENSAATTGSLIVETDRGPSLAGTGITVHAIMDYLKEEFLHVFIRQIMPILSAEQLQAALQYIEEHRERVWREYDEIVRRSEEERAYYEKNYPPRSPYPPDLSPKERRELIRQKLIHLKQESLSENGNNDSA